MNRKTVIILCAIVAFVTGCSKEEAELRLPGFEVPVVTGYYLRDEVAISRGYVGVPNVKPGTHSDYSQSTYFITFFPNPARNSGTIHLKSPNDYDVKKFWITQAIYSSPISIPGASVDGMNNIIAGGAPLIQGETTDKNIYLDLTDLPSGYYRLYVSVNDHLFYDNIVIDKNYFFHH